MICWGFSFGSQVKTLKTVQLNFICLLYRNEIWILIKKSVILSIMGRFLFSSSGATFLSLLTLVLTGEVLVPAKAFMVLAFMKILHTMFVSVVDDVPLAFAWLFSGTIRENVLFGEPYNKEIYAEVVEACALREDISRFPNGDLTFVGEHGVILSWGQRARVSLARALYADVDVYLLDDPLSAVDAKVGEQIFHQCICRFLKNKTTLMVTFTKKHMFAADQVVILHDGSVLRKGSLTELQSSEEIDAIIEEKIPPTLSKKAGTSLSSSDKTTCSFDEHLEITEKEKSIGKNSAAMCWEYFRAGTHPTAFYIAVALFFLGSQG